jgi:hypothetical protein
MIFGTTRALGQNRPHQKICVERSSFGKLPDGADLELFTLKNAQGTTAKLIPCGAALQSFYLNEDAERDDASFIVASKCARV